MIEYIILKGVERRGTRFEPGTVVSSNQLRGWGIPNLIAIGALERLEGALGLADSVTDDEEE